MATQFRELVGNVADISQLYFGMWSHEIGCSTSVFDHVCSLC